MRTMCSTNFESFDARAFPAIFLEQKQDPWHDSDPWESQGGPIEMAHWDMPHFRDPPRVQLLKNQDVTGPDSWVKYIHDQLPCKPWTPKIVEWGC